MTPKRCLVVIPVYNDWEAFCQLLRGLENVLRLEGLQAEVLAVDDGSSTSLDPAEILHWHFKALTSLSVLKLGRNVGHQRAIAIALAHVTQH